MSWLPERIGDGVQRELGRLGPAGGMAKIVEAWPAAVGEPIARHAWPARVARDGTLHVATSSSAWSYELGLLEREICGRLAAALGAEAPPSLRFAPGRLPEPSREAPEGSAGGPARPAPEHRREAAGLAAAIEDENLRKVVAEAAAASLARAAADRRIW